MTPGSEPALDHGRVEEDNLVDRYVMGTLTGALRLSFEEHLVDCPQCLDLMEATEDFRHTLKKVAVEEATRPRTSWFPRFGGPAMAWWRRRSVLAAVTMLLIAGPAALVVRERRGAQAEVEVLRSRLADGQARYAELARTLEAERSRGSEAAGLPASGPSSPSPTRATVFALSLTRGGDGDAAANRIPLPHSPQWIVLSLEQEAQTPFEGYRATLQGSAGRTLSRWADVAPGGTGDVAIAFPSALLVPGDYRVVLEGRGRDGTYTPVARYDFRATVR